MKDILPILWGLLFGIGLTISGMTQPTKVIGFLDFAGTWDPTLAFVMGGAIAVHLPLRHFIMKRDRPSHSDAFPANLPPVVDRQLLVGAGLFGMGWGLSGYCPGPVVTSFLFSNDAFLLFLGMAAGMGLFHVQRPMEDAS